jgi:imidazolonepropionase-like amidohydrolase
MTMSIPKPLVLLLALTAMSVSAQPPGRAKFNAEQGVIPKEVPAKVDAGTRYLFYLHGRIIEDEGERPTSPKFGVYEYEKILGAFRSEGFVVISEVRPKGTDPERYADKVVAQIQALLKAGVPEQRITVVGASKGAVIAMLVSSRLKNWQVNFVIMGNCNDAILQQFDIDLWGNVLSVYDTSDELGGSCEKVFDRAAGLNTHREIKINTGLGHGFLYKPIGEWLAPAVGWARRQKSDDSRTGSFVLQRVTVIDATGRPPQPDMTVVITGDRITALGRAGKVAVPRGAQIINARGKYLIPGLWDMHTHIVASAARSLPLLVANGVTGIRNMHTSARQPMERIRQLRREIEEGKIVGPRLIANGPILDGANPIHPGSIATANEAEARQAVNKLKEDGADFIKVYNLLSRQAYFAIADEAKKSNIPFAGHVPDAVSALEASEAGQKSIEHNEGILIACSSRETELRKRLTEAPEDKTIGLRVHAESIDSYDEEKAAKLFATFVRNQTWMCPTLVELRAETLSDGEILTQPRFKYISGRDKEQWRQIFEEPFSSEEIALARRSFRRERELVKAMRRAGVKILAGTDVGNPFLVPGLSLHDELALLVETGLTPMEALQSATRNPSQYLGLLDSLGTIETGKIADLVLLDANPLVDIRNTRKINSVVVRGRVILQPGLRKLLSQVEALAR